jgi:hypothetical protein
MFYVLPSMSGSLSHRPVVWAGTQPLIDEKFQVVKVNVPVGIQVGWQPGPGFKPVFGKKCELFKVNEA